MKKQLCTLFLLLLSSQIFAQVGINATGAAPASSAMLDVSSTNKGVLISRMTTAQKNAITSPAQGLMVYDATLQQFSYWTGTAWANFGSTALGTNGWQQVGQNINYTNVIPNNNSIASYTNASGESIPDGSFSGVSRLINVPLTGEIINPNLITISITLNHNYCGDIVATLISPSGNQFVLINRLGLSSIHNNGSSNVFSNVLNFNNLANGQIITTYENTNSIATGTYLPSGGKLPSGEALPLANLNNLANEQINGDWTLLIQDLSSVVTGNFISWSINIGANALGTVGKIGVNTTSPQVALDVQGGMNVSKNVGIGTTTPLAKLDVNGSMLVSKNVGIGTTTPQVALDVKGGMNVSEGVVIGTPTTPAYLAVSGSMFVSQNISIRDNISIRGSIEAPLQFDNSLQNKKLVLFNSALDQNQFYGFGINPSILRYQVSNTTNDHVFYAGTSDMTSNELMRMKGTGALEVNGSIKTKYSGSVIVTPPGTGNQLFNLTIPALPAGWDLTNTVVLVTCADGGYGQIGQVKLLNATTIELRENVSVGGASRYNYIVFKL